MKRDIHLRLYGTIPHPPREDLSWELYQSQAMARLRDISLSSVPSRFLPHSAAASRFEHSVGVGYLARRLADSRPALRAHRSLLISAALLHDIGSAPFSHIAEIFMYDLTGDTHEERTAKLLAPGGELAEILGEYDVDPAAVCDLITGRHPELGALIAGSIDLDNIDNSQHLLVSLGHAEQALYDPLRLIGAYRLRSGRLYLDAEYLPEILAWQMARRRLYDILHSEPNLSSAAMLYRALESAYEAEALPEEFFALGESDALHHLRRRTTALAHELVERLVRWQQYPMIFQQLTAREDPRLVPLYGDWRARKELTDRLAAELGIPAGDFVLYVGRDRAEKAIDLPFTGRGAEAVQELLGGVAGRQRLALFAHKRHSSLRGSKRVRRIVERVITELPESGRSTGDSHTFF